MKQQLQTKVLILDANQRSALAAVRSLGKKGIAVYSADSTSKTLAGSSKFSKQSLTYHCPNKSPTEFIESLVALCLKEDITHVFPMTEITFTLVTKHIERFKNQKIPFPSYATIEQLSNKINLFRLAQKLELPVPKTIYVMPEDSTLQACLDFNEYPMVLKPYKSRILDNNRWILTEVQIVKNKNELEAALADNAYLEEYPLMIQSFIDGYGSGIFTLYKDGQDITFFSHKRLREKPPGGGVSVLSQSISVESEPQRIAKILLDAANWHGVAMVEYRVDQKTGIPYLMEVNTRFWGSLQLSIDTGIDFPYLLFKITESEQVPEKIEYIPGNKLRWFLGDLDSLYLTFKSSSLSLKDKLKALIKFVMPSGNTKHEVLRFEDPQPGFYELKKYIGSFFN